MQFVWGPIRIHSDRTPSVMTAKAPSQGTKEGGLLAEEAEFPLLSWPELASCRKHFHNIPSHAMYFLHLSMEGRLCKQGWKTVCGNKIRISFLQQLRSFHILRVFQALLKSWNFQVRDKFSSSLSILSIWCRSWEPFPGFQVSFRPNTGFLF